MISRLTLTPDPGKTGGCDRGRENPGGSIQRCIVMAGCRQPGDASERHISLLPRAPTRSLSVSQHDAIKPNTEIIGDLADALLGVAITEEQGSASGPADA
jgi:hypothetical protein